MSETLDTSGLDLSKIQAEDLQKLLEKIGNTSDFDFATLDEDDNSLSEDELRIKEKLGKVSDQKIFIENIIKSVELITKTNKETNESGTENINEKLQNIWDSYKQKNKGKETNNQIINDKMEAQKLQIKLIEENYPELSGNKIVSGNIIRSFNEEQGEYVITAEELKNKLQEQGVEGSSYLETMRYLKWIEKIEGNENLTDYLHEIFKDIINGNIENSDYKKEIALLKKYLPESFLEDGNLKKFAEEFNLKIDEFNIERAYEAENEDETNEGELEVIIENLIDNLGEKRAHELMQQCVKIGLNRKESIIFLKQYSKTLETELEAYKIEHKEYYEAKELEENKENKIDEEKLNSNDNYYISTTEKDYIDSGNGFQIIGKDGIPIEGLIISEEEKNNTIGNPEATENLINFYEFFKELNLLGVWKYRKELMIAVGDININPNDGDSIKDEELRKFGNKLLAFIANVANKGKGENVELNSLSSVENELKKFSGANSMLSDSKTFNINGEDKFTAYLRNQQIIGGTFKTSKFRENL